MSETKKKELSETTKKTEKKKGKSGAGRAIRIILLFAIVAAGVWAWASDFELPFAEKEYKWSEQETRIVNNSRFALDPLTILKDDIRKKERNPIKNDAFIFYFSGADTRNALLVDSNSDVNIIAVINPTTRQILFVNTPRDYYVQISIGNGAYDKLTHCGNYGLQCSRDTMAILYGINIDYAAQINFVGLKTLVDQIGGVDVFSDYTFTAYNGTSFAYGNNHLNGAKALTFCRERKSLPGGDNDRGRHQIKVLTAIVQKITSTPSLLLNYEGILASLDGLFKTDMSMDEIANLVAMQTVDDRPWDINYYAVTGYNSYSSYTYSMPGSNLYVMEQNPSAVAEARALIEMVLSGESI